MELNVLTLRHGRTVFKLAVRKARQLFEKKRVPSPSPEPAAANELIDVKALLRETTMEQLIVKAESYFSGLKDWTYHLTKPFAAAGDTPGLLINFATMIQGLRLVKGSRILDFGAGSGWTSRFLTQLGCDVVVMDVSPTALKMAAALYEQSPVIGRHHAPQYLLFDGYRIDLPDQSVDRILCFDAFHHAPNPEAVIAEFARILRPGGIAAFAEPGPHHSQSPQSQFEMRTYGVLENDIDIHAIWTTARNAGFSRIELMAYNVTSHLLSLEQYDELLAGGEAYLRWAEATRAFLGNVRNFFLHREGSAPLDSRQTSGLSLTIEAPAILHVPTDNRIRFDAVLRNTGTAIWLGSENEDGGVSLGIHLYDSAGNLAEFDFHWQGLGDRQTATPPGAAVTVSVDAPSLPPGSYVLEVDAVANHVCWFGQVGGSKPAQIALEVASADLGE